MRLLPIHTHAEVEVLVDELTAAREELAAAQDELVQLRALLTEHHAAGAFDDILIGDRCPVCERHDA